MRHNNGGNIHSWILKKLLRKAWFYWQPRVGNPTGNMQYAFRGHVVVLCDQNTASDGEAFAEGFRRLGLGKVIGTRTWGGEVWLSQSTRTPRLPARTRSSTRRSKTCRTRLGGVQSRRRWHRSTRIGPSNREAPRKQSVITNR